MAEYIVDISENNGDVDFQALVNDGITGVIIRAGYGQGNIDTNFYINCKKAKEYGLDIGAYWFSYALTVEQARLEGEFCAETVNTSGVIMNLPIFYDQEGSSWRDNHDFNMDIMTDQCIAFKEGLGNLNYGIYANYNYFTNYLDFNVCQSLGKIWLAQYSDSPSMECDIWQYSEDYYIEGKKFDINIMNM